LKILFDNLKKEQINVFFILSIFLTTISYFLVKAFFGRGEPSDIIFVILIPIISEASFSLIVISKKYFLKKNIDFYILGLSFVTIFLLWDYNSYNILKFFNFGVYIFFTLLSLLILNKISINKNYGKNDFLSLFIFILFLNGIFFQIDYLNFKNLFVIVLIYTFYSISVISLKRLSKYFNIIFAIFIFLIFFKVFILSSDKDAFHYSFIIGPGYSMIAGYEILNEVVNQYGYLNILVVKLFSIFTNNRIDYSLILIIIFLFLIFFILLFKKLKKITSFPAAILVLFTGATVFANIGIDNLSSSILIPSASVFRFLPAILVMLFLTKIIFFKSRKNLEKYTYFFYFFLIAGVLWSFESFVFVFFSLLSLFIFFLLFTIFKKNKISDNFYTEYKPYIYQNIFLIIIFLLIIFFSFKDTQMAFFYEYVANGKSIKSLDILNSRYTLVFVCFLLINYLFLRSSLKSKNLKIFYNNLIWFSLFVSFSAYFVIRSIHSNLFALFPFYIYFMANMKSESSILLNIKKLFIDVLILTTVTAVIVSISSNKAKFYKRLISSTFLEVPDYIKDNYRPNLEIQSILDSYINVPVTLITGNTIHNYNKNLSYGGYGLPILPLEQFNLLTTERKINIMNLVFKKNNQHLILCLYECSFYNENIKKKNWESIFLPTGYSLKKITIKSKNNEILYLVVK
jgi:hypothetical protein